MCSTLKSHMLESWLSVTVLCHVRMSIWLQCSWGDNTCISPGTHLENFGFSLFRIPGFSQKPPNPEAGKFNALGGNSHPMGGWKRDGGGGWRRWWTNTPASVPWGDNLGDTLQGSLGVPSETEPTPCCGRNYPIITFLDFTSSVSLFCPLMLNTLEKEMPTHSSILAWRTPWTAEPGGLQSVGSQRVGHNWATNAC